MKSLRDAIYITDVVYQRLGAGEKNLIKMLSLTVPSSAIVSGIVLFYAIKLLIGSSFIAFLGGLFIGYLLYLHDSSLLAESGTTRSYFRLGLSLVFALLMAVPLKISIVGEDLTQRLKLEIRDYNLDIDQQLMAAKQVIYNEEKGFMEDITEAGKNYARTKNTQELIEARRAKEVFDKQKEERLVSLENTYNAMKKTEEVTRLDLAAYYFTNMFNAQNPKDLFINLLVFILLLLVEALPAVLRLKLEDSEYLRKIGHNEGLTLKTDREVELLEEELLTIDDLDGLSEKIDKIHLWKLLENASKSRFSNIDELREVAKAYAKSKEQEKGKKEQQQTSGMPPPNHNGQKKKDSDEEFTDFEYTT